MKRIAVIGCSHTSYDHVRVTPGPGIDWVHHMANQHKHVKFDNYAHAGTGPLYYDLALKNIINNKGKDYYDAIIVQLTASGRWILPLNVDHTYVDLIEDIFSCVPITDNYDVYRMYHPFSIITRNGSHVLNSNENKKQTVENLIDSIRREGLSNSTVVGVNYEHMFIKSLTTVYNHIFNDVFFFDFLDGYLPEHMNNKIMRNNIGHTLPFVHWVSETYSEDFLVSEVLDDSLHCTMKGNQLLCDEYLMNSAIGSYLNNANSI